MEFNQTIWAPQSTDDGGLIRDDANGVSCLFDGRNSTCCPFMQPHLRSVVDVASSADVDDTISIQKGDGGLRTVGSSGSGSPLHVRPLHA